MKSFNKQEYLINSNALGMEIFDILIEFKADSTDILEKLYKRYKLKSKDIIQFEEKPLGTYLADLLNNIDKITNIINESENNVSILRKTWKNKCRILKGKTKNKNSTEYKRKRTQIDKEFNNECINIVHSLKIKLFEINPFLSILDSFVNQTLIDFDNSYNNEFNKSINKISKIENEYPSFSNTSLSIEASSKSKVYNSIKKRLHYLGGINHVQSLITRCFSEIKLDIRDIKNLIDTAFVRNEDTRNNKFSGIHSIIPACKIEYETEYLKFPQPYIYTYVVENLKDLVAISIYQLSLNHKVIIKCKNCGKFVVPDRTDRLYCSEECKWRYMTRKSKENSSAAYDYYRTLYNRYKNTKSYAKEFEELKNIYYDQYKSKQIDDEIFIKMLNDFENRTKSSHTVKRGRPAKKK